MLKRKIETYLADWKRSEDRKPLVIKGIRQCGKTYIVQKFARENYESVVYMNFILEPDNKSAFTGNIDVDTIILNLSALIQGSRFIEGKTCIILDEIQECREARTALKSFHIDGRFDVIATGSLLGVKGYGQSKKKKEDVGQDSVPVGYETVIDMYPLDFEEFLWANGIGQTVIDSVKSCFENEKAVPDGIHKVMMEMLYRYVIVGRLPISTFGDTERLEHGAVGGIERSSSDHRAGAKLLVQFLAERGCRKVLWYFPARNHPRLVWQAERQAGCEEAAREAKIELLPLDTPLPITNEVGSAENFRRCARMTAEALAPHVKSAAPVEAILVDSDVAVPYFQRALRELGATPGEIPVLGYDNYYATTRPYRWEPTPPAATVDKNDPEIGREAVGLLRKRLESDDIFSRPFRSVIRPRLVIPQ